MLPLLALTGLGLGVFIPANNTSIMRSAPAGSPATLSGLINMARAMGTTLGIALVTLALHLAIGSEGAAAGASGADALGALGRLAFGMLAGATDSRVNRPGRNLAAAISICCRSGPSPATTRCASGIRLTASIPVCTRLLSIKALTIKTTS